MITETWDLERVPTPCSLTIKTFSEWIDFLQDSIKKERKLIKLTDKLNPSRNGYYFVIEK